MDIDIGIDGDYEADYGDMDNDMDASSSDGRSASYGYETGEDLDEELECEYEDDAPEVEVSEDGLSARFSHRVGENEDEEEAEHDHAWSRAFTRPHVEDRHRPKNKPPESIGNILRRVLGIKKRKEPPRPEGYIPDETLNMRWYRENIAEAMAELEKWEEEAEQDIEEQYEEYESKGTLSHGEGSGTFGGR